MIKYAGVVFANFSSQRETRAGCPDHAIKTQSSGEGFVLTARNIYF
jgi:hypothetical protein